MSATGLRLFIAIRVPDGVKDKLREVQIELKRVLRPGLAAWTKPDNMHLTLRFLGKVESSRLPEMSARIRGALTGFGSVDLVCERLGCFPELRFPTVVWAGVHDADERLLALQRRLEDAVENFAEKQAEGRFVGHVTVARPKKIKRADAERLAGFVERAVERRFGAWRASEVELIRSERSPQGSRYTTLDVFPLSL